MVATALMQTLEFTGPHFGPELQRAWMKLLSLVAGEMLQGADEVKDSGLRRGG